MMREPATGDLSFDARRWRIFSLKTDIACPDAVLRGLIGDGREEACRAIDAALADPVATLGPGFAGFSFSRHHGGTFHGTYRGSRDGEAPIALRIPLLRTPFFMALMQAEAAMAALLHAHDVPTPALAAVPCRVGRESSMAHVSAWIGAPTLASLDHDDAAMATALPKVVDLLGRLHGIEGEGFGPLSFVQGPPGASVGRGVHDSWHGFILTGLAAHAAACRASGAIGDGECAQVLRHFGNAERLLASVTRGVVLHGDPGSHNLLIEDGRIVGLLDLEDAILGDPLFDHANLATFHPRRRHPSILSAIPGVMADPDARRRFWLYFLRIALAKTVHRARFGLVDRPGREPAARRIHVALEHLA